MERINIIIMAGGLGKRMNSTLPKVLHKINNKPMIVNIIETISTLNINRIFIRNQRKYEFVCFDMLSRYYSTRLYKKT